MRRVLELDASDIALAIAKAHGVDYDRVALWVGYGTQERKEAVVVATVEEEV